MTKIMANFKRIQAEQDKMRSKVSEEFSERNQKLKSLNNDADFKRKFR